MSIERIEQAFAYGRLMMIQGARGRRLSGTDTRFKGPYKPCFSIALYLAVLLSYRASIYSQWIETTVNEAS